MRTFLAIYQIDDASYTKQKQDIIVAVIKVSSQYSLVSYRDIAKVFEGGNIL